MKFPTLILSLLALSSVNHQVQALWPQPKFLSNGTSVVTLSDDFTIKVSGGPGSGSDCSSDLKSAIERATFRLDKDRHERLVLGRGSADEELVKSSKYEIKALQVQISSTKSESIADEVNKKLEDRDESYTLSVPDDKQVAVIRANTSLGALRGLETFSQLVYFIPEYVGGEEDDDTALLGRAQIHLDPLVHTLGVRGTNETEGKGCGTRYIMGAPIEIRDEPAFPYRGFLLDTSRNFYGVEDIERTLEAMSWAKLNVFHWHIVDSQSWPLELKSYPALAKKGAYSKSKTYSQAQLKHVIDYANQRGIDVMLEFDTPGHTAIIAEAYPEYVACFVASPWQTYANEPPAGQLRIADPNVVKFAQDIFKEMAEIVPGKYISTGGDELNYNCYNDDSVTQSQLASSSLNLNETIKSFIKSTHETLRSSGKSPVVWEEIVLDNPVWEQALEKEDTLVAVWRSSENVKGVVDKGYKVIHAASDYFYLDCGHGEWLGNFTAGNSWCDPYKTWQKSYSFDPFANLTTPAQQKLVQGGAALLWSEQTDSQNLDRMIWPRAAAAAEVFWTGNSYVTDGGKEQKRDGQEALARLNNFRFRQVQRGLGSEPLQPEWCALRPGKCDLNS